MSLSVPVAVGSHQSSLPLGGIPIGSAHNRPKPFSYARLGEAIVPDYMPTLDRRFSRKPLRAIWLEAPRKCAKLVRRTKPRVENSWQRREAIADIEFNLELKT